MPSVQHQFLARAIPKVRRSSEVEDPEAVRRGKLTEHAKAVTTPPARVISGCDVTMTEDFGFPVYNLSVKGAHPTRSILYLHGGGYVSGADRAHWKYVAKLAEHLHARVVVPAYPLAPEHTWRDSHPQLLSSFEQVAIESPRGVMLMGDSAGGGFALALALQLKHRAGPQPTHLALISPWVDLTSSTPGTVEAAARDPWLKMSRLKLFAGWWAGGDDLRRPEISPLFGDLSGLPPTVVWCGTLDTLHPQVRELVKRATAAGADITYYEEPDLLHVYPLLPIPEARKAFAQLEGFL